MSKRHVSESDGLGVAAQGEVDLTRHDNVLYVRDVMQATATVWGARMRQIRKDRRMSHDTLAARVGALSNGERRTSRQHLIRLEQGKHQPRPRLRALIAQALDAPELNPDDDEEADPVADLVDALMRVLVSRKAAA
jgi:transcriptional regulator with XRE-family HTH domain